MTSKIEQFESIVKEHAYREIDGVMVDAQTANAIMTVYKNLSPKNQTSFLSMDVFSMGVMAWRLLGGQGK